MAASLRELLDESTAQQIDLMAKSIQEWWNSEQTQRKVRGILHTLNEVLESEEFERELKALIGFARLYQRMEEQADERGIEVDELFEERSDQFRQSPVNAALGFSFGDFSYAYRAALLHGRLALAQEVVEFATSDEVLGEIGSVVEHHPAVDPRSERAIEESIDAIRREDYFAGHRTLIPEIERFVVNVGIRYDALERVDGEVKYKSSKGVAMGFTNKAEKVATEIPTGAQELRHLKEHWNDHLRATRHGEEKENRSPELLTADAIFVFHTMLIFLPESSASPIDDDP